MIFFFGGGGETWTNRLYCRVVRGSKIGLPSRWTDLVLLRQRVLNFLRALPSRRRMSQLLPILSPSCPVSPVELTEGTRWKSRIVGRRESLVLYKSFNNVCPRYLLNWTEGVARGSLGGRISKRSRSLRIDYKESIPPGWESIPGLLTIFTNSGSS